jgi:hypothetical protein
LSIKEPVMDDPDALESFVASTVDSAEPEPIPTVFPIL